jgi:hypothetical protein
VATEHIRAATQVELAERAGRGATLGQLLDHVDARSRELRGRSFSEAQGDELRLYCWMMCERRSRGVLWGAPKEWGYLEEDIGG